MPEVNPVDARKASDLVRDYIFKNFQPWVFLFQIESVKPNTADNVYIVDCSFIPVPGGYDRHHYTIKVDISNWSFISVVAFSVNQKTGEKTPLGEIPKG